AVLPLHEFVGKAEAHFRVCTQFGNAADTQGLRARLAYAQRIGVVETQPIRDADAQRLQACPQGRDVGVRRDVLEQLLGQGAGVFRVDVDVAVQQGSPEDAGATQLALVHG